MKRFAEPPRATIDDVAQLAAVSKTTVSHVLSRNRPVSLPTRERVEIAIEKLGYRPDGLARSLRTRRTHMVALMIPDIANPYYPPLARGLEDGAGGGYRTFVCSTDGVAGKEQEFLEEVVDRRADGIAVDSFAMTADQIASVVPSGTAVVRIGTTVIDDPGYDTVHADDEHGAFDAVTHLVDRGHRRIAMIQGPPGAGGKRNNGYLRALQTADITADAALIASAEWTRAGGALAARALLEITDRPTAIFCANDLIALGAMDSARARGMSVPDDLSLVGFDDIEAAAMVSPALSTVSNPAYEIGLLAGYLLRERMSGQYRDVPRTVTLPCRLIRRGTA